MAGGVLVVLALLLGNVAGEAHAELTRWCDRPVVACRTIECAPLQGRERHRCLTACKTRSHCAAPGAGLGTLGIITTRCRQDPDGTFWFGHTLQVPTLTRQESHDAVLRWVVPFLEAKLAGDERYESLLTAAPPGAVLHREP